MSGGSGEPLSEELERKVTNAAKVIENSLYSEIPDVLRAFAREIQEPLEKKRALDTPIIHAQAASIIHLRVRLLATEESERALRQKLTSLESVDKQLTDAREEAKNLAEALERLEWCEDEDVCPECTCHIEEGHDEGCRLSVVIATYRASHPKVGA